MSTASSYRQGDAESAGSAFFVDGWPSSDFLVRYGITRIGDLTGLDRIGLPVWFASRPNSRGLSVSQGKGLTHAQARISAVMESVEGAIAEQTEPLISHSASIAAMRERGWKIVPLSRMQRCRASRIDEVRERSWVRGKCYRSGAEIYAPYELVGLDMRAESSWDHSSFLMSTIGLAAGSDESHAALHAICELIENDATTMVDLIGVGASRSRGIDCRGTRHAGLAEAIAAVERAGMNVRFFEVTGVIPVPVVGCFVESPFHSAQKAAVGIAAGFACRPFGADAALSALLEAVQSRLTKIAGSREDLSDSSYRTGRASLPQVEGELIRVDDLVMNGAERLSGNLPAMLDAVTQSLTGHSAADEVYLFPLSPSDADFAVVRALVADLETVVDDGVVKLGSHAIRRLLALKEQK